MSYYIDTVQGTRTVCCIVKHSFNKIDLVEVGDYVNGERVKQIHTLMLGIKTINDYDITYKIKKIVTKEQFAQMQYNFEEE